MERLTPLLAAARDRWTALGAMQRRLLIGLAAAAAIGIAVGLLVNRTDYVSLTGQLDPKDAAAVVAKLQELKVPYRIGGDSFAILVPRADKYAAQLALAEAGLPRGSSTGLELFDEPKLGATDFERRVNYLRAQQGELERAIMRMAGVQYANVKLAIPEQSVFVRDRQPVTAAVLVQARAGNSLSAEQVTAIINFLSRSVQGLKAENITVVDAAGRVLTGVPGSPRPGLADPDQIKREQQLQADMEQRVQTLLTPVFGPGNVVARVNVSVNLDETRTESRTVLTGVPREVRSEREATQGRNTAPGGRPPENGAPPVYQGQDAGGVQDVWKTSTATVYELGEKKELSVVGPGANRRVSVGVAINRPDLTAEQVRQVKEMVAAAVGAEPERISVTAMLFNTDGARLFTPTPAAPALPAANPALWVALAGALGIALLGVWGARRRPALATAGGPMLAGAPGAMLTGADGAVPTGAPGALGTEGAAPARELPAAASPLAVVLGRSEPPAEAAAAAAAQEAAGAGAPPAAEVVYTPSPAAQLRNVAIKQIHEAPEEAVALLRAWIRGE